MNVNEFTKIFEDIVMVEHGTITSDTQLDSLDDWDSLSRASLLTTFEEEFNLKIDEAILRKVSSFAEILELIKDHLINN
ncbi:acyl carrier protein [Paenibacillus qinlingensis]|uniref:acyl carrier protein n=1 Tax=Paenibacillus qinlingensis TaxID=1837343 RepID=UPI001566406C|nr:acyl carrier protein [Paenibacillus qinlingensis]NQX60247.1 acyl carrier protein [Paenibacillus qinlingensis]